MKDIITRTLLPWKKIEERDVYVKTKDLSKDQIVAASQEELASHVMHKWS